LKSQAFSRKQFIRGQPPGESVIRPPWSADESQFIESCTRCYKCAETCPLNLIVKGTGGFPETTFLRQGCDYCEACVRACPEDSLNINNNIDQIPWSQHAVISEQCFVQRGVVCRSCGEVCEPRAIEFRPVPGGSEIKINVAACNGCGECVHVCPAQAIEIQKLNPQSLTENMLESFSGHSVKHNPAGEK